jgi:uncharacterized membrane protein
MDRVVAFSDGIFAFAITLLVVSLDVPEIPTSLASRDLVPVLLAQAPRFASYAFSFLMVAIYWMAHHRMFQYIVRYDTPLLGLNFLMLFGVAFLPYPVELLGRYGDLPAAEAFYAASMAFVGFASAGVWTYAVRHQLLSPDTPPGVVSHFKWRALVAPVVFVVSALVASVSVNAAYAVLLLIGVIQGQLSRRYAGAGLR